MDIDQSHKQPPMPAKLRWRPYANGTSKKTSKLKKLNAKAAAHKIKGEQYYSGKNSLTGIQLQWEESETAESMSHGGHSHPHPSGDAHRSRDTSPSASSDKSSSSSGSDPGNNGGFSITGVVQRAVTSLPSPPSTSSTLLGTTRLDLVGGTQTDLSQFNASVPGLMGNGLVQNGVSSNSPITDLDYQSFLGTIYQSNVKSIFHTPALFGNGLSGADGLPATAAPVPMATSTASALLGSTNISMFLSDPDRGLGNDDLLGMATFDELLCGFTENPTTNTFSDQAAAQMLASPLSMGSVQSFNSSPLSGVLDLNGSSTFSRGTSPSSATGSFSPLAIGSSAFAELLKQPGTPQKQTPPVQQQPIGGTFSYTGSLQDISSPFNCLSTGTDPTAWVSLFPAAMDVSVAAITGSTISTAAAPSQQQQQAPSSRPQRVEMATQTDGPYDTPPSPLSAKGSSIGSQATPPILDLEYGLSPEEELDLLNLFSEMSGEMMDIPSPPPSGDESGDERTQNTTTAATTTTNPTQSDRVMWNWVEELLSPGTPGAGSGTSTHHSHGPTMTTGFPSGTIGNGGLIRTLQGTSQRPSSSAKSAQGKTATTAAGQPSKEEESNKSKAEGKSEETKAKAAEESQVADKKPPAEQAKKEDGGALGGLMDMIRALWIGGKDDK